MKELSQNKKKRLLFKWGMLITVMILFLVIAVIFNFMAWIGSNIFLKEYANPTIYAATVLIFPSVTLYVTILGILKVYAAMKISNENKHL